MLPWNLAFIQQWLWWKQGQLSSQVVSIKVGTCGSDWLMYQSLCCLHYGQRRQLRYTAKVQAIVPQIWVEYYGNHCKEQEIQQQQRLGNYTQLGEGGGCQKVVRETFYKLTQEGIWREVTHDTWHKKHVAQKEICRSMNAFSSKPKDSGSHRLNYFITRCSAQNGTPFKHTAQFLD